MGVSSTALLQPAPEDAESVAEVVERVRANEDYYDSVNPVVQVYTTALRGSRSGGFTQGYYRGRIAETDRTSDVGSARAADALVLDEFDPPETRSARRYVLVSDTHGAEVFGIEGKSDSYDEVIRGVMVDTDV